MSWIFHEPFEPAIYVRRRVAPPSAVAPNVRSFSQTARFHGLDLFTQEIWPAQRRAHAPLVARRFFRRPDAAYALDVFADDLWTAPRRAYAPRHVVPVIRPFSPARRVLASLLAGGVYEEIGLDYRQPAFVQGHPTPGLDVGRTASFAVIFTGKGDDPYGPVGVATAPGSALGADTLRELAVQNPAVFGGASASRKV